MIHLHKLAVEKFSESKVKNIMQLIQNASIANASFQESATGFKGHISTRKDDLLIKICKLNAYIL